MPNNEFESRRQAAVAGLDGRSLDAFLVSFGPNLRYLTGFSGSNGLLLLLPDDAVFVTDPRYEIQSAQEVSCRIRVARGPLLNEVLDLVKKKKLRRLGFEPAHVTFDTYESLKSHVPLKTSLVPVTGWIETLRMIKSSAEIELIRRSVLTSSKAFEQAVRRVREGMSEADLAAELEHRMRRLGAEKPAFDTIVAGGARSALPHAQPTAAPLRSGDLVVVDMGAMRDGYASDMTRMLFVGRPGARVKRLYRAVLEAQLAAIAAVRPGITTAHVDAQARRVLRAEKLERAFIHSTGHGLGLEIHEPPRVGRRDRNRLRAGMVITIEPGVYLENFGGIRIEDTVAVTDNGCDILTPTSKELRVIS